MTQFHVDSDALLGTTSTLRGTVDQMQSLMATLQGQLQHLSQAWTGGAALAFNDLVSEWQATQRLVESHLEEITVALASAHDHYSDVEASNLALFNR